MTGCAGAVESSAACAGGASPGRATSATAAITTAATMLTAKVARPLGPEPNDDLIAAHLRTHPHHPPYARNIGPTSATMASMHAVELFDPGPDPTLALREVDRDLPAPSSGQVRLRITASAVCRTDLQLTTGDLPAHLLPIVPGHQVVGVIDAIGPDVTGWTLGDRAGLVWLARACGECRFCLRDRENLCLHAEFTGWDVDGGYADYVLADAAFAHPLAVLPTTSPMRQWRRCCAAG